MIRLRGLGHSYDTHRVLENFTLDVAAGEVVALVGPNGAGKSTVLRLATGGLLVEEGAVEIGGFDLATRPIDARRRLGYLPQKLGVSLSTVVSDLARLVAAARGVSAVQAFDALGDAGLGARLDATLGELSGGQRQRVLLVLASLGPVAVLLLDEPAISLDADGSADVQAIICRARDEGTAVLFASHHLVDVATLADRMVVLVGGHPVAQGSVAELVAEGGQHWTGLGAPPIEAAYRAIVTRARGGQDRGRAPLALVGARTA
ncbi:MAG TPA: ABC transporter ATP-binding protein [Gemmatimonadales bacterium]|nr:ABC transporter ATP-binding protein [Gemmatimonadales bacterium]